MADNTEAHSLSRQNIPFKKKCNLLHNMRSIIVNYGVVKRTYLLVSLIKQNSVIIIIIIIRIIIKVSFTAGNQ